MAIRTDFNFDIVFSRASFDNKTTSTGNCRLIILRVNSLFHRGPLLAILIKLVKPFTWLSINAHTNRFELEEPALSRSFP